MKRKQQQEPDFFAICNEHDLYYLLGLLFTDGNLNAEETRITLSLTNEKIIQCLYSCFSASFRKIYQYKPKLENANTIYTILNESKIAISKLKQMGYSSCNSINKPFPKIPDKNLGDFLRGVFDGDGCVYVSNTFKGKKYLTISITCASYDFTYGLKESLEKCGFHPTVVIDSRRKHNEIKTYYVKMNRQKEIEQFYEMIYKNSGIRNEEKYKKFCYEDIV